MPTRLRKERKRARLSQTDLAALSRIQQGTISKLEAGKMRRPSYEILRRLSVALNKCGRKVTPFELQPSKQLTLIPGFRSDRRRRGAA